MHLVIDIGNSNVVFGIHHDDVWIHSWRLATIKTYEMKMYYQKRLIHFTLENKITLSEIDKITISSVVPQINTDFIELIEEVFGKTPHVVAYDSMQGLSIKIDNPSEMGTDLIANAVAAVQLYHDHAIVVDFGTALTFTAVAKDMTIYGVAIAPGLYTALKSLYGDTAQLPEVSPKLPDTAIGKNTTHAIQSGICWGYTGLIKAVVDRMKAEMDHDCQLIATGGLSSVLGPLHDYFDVMDKDLTLMGIKIIGDQV